MKPYIKSLLFYFIAFCGSIVYIQPYTQPYTNILIYIGQTALFTNLLAFTNVNGREFFASKYELEVYYDDASRQKIPITNEHFRTLLNQHQLVASTFLVTLEWPHMSQPYYNPTRFPLLKNAFCETDFFQEAVGINTKKSIDRIQLHIFIEAPNEKRFFRQAKC